MRGQLISICISLMALLVLFPETATGAKKPKLKPEDVVQRHLEALGPAQALSEMRSLKAEGTGAFEVITGGSGRLQGPATFLSEGTKLRMSIVFGINEYPSEEIAYNGRKVSVGYLQPGVRSKLGHFLYDFNDIVSEGLFGGALSTGWSLLDLDSRRPKLKYEGLKKVDGTKYHTLRYQRRKGSDAQVRLYFDTETFRHSHTIYKIRISPSIGHSDRASASQPETIKTLKESFSRFQKIGDLTLPSRWTIEYTEEIGREGSALRWTMQYTTIRKNAVIEPSVFELGLK